MHLLLIWHYQKRLIFNSKSMNFDSNYFLKTNAALPKCYFSNKTWEKFINCIWTTITDYLSLKSYFGRFAVKNSDFKKYANWELVQRCQTFSFSRQTAMLAIFDPSRKEYEGFFFLKEH